MDLLDRARERTARRLAKNGVSLEAIEKIAEENLKREEFSLPIAEFKDGIKLSKKKYEHSDEIGISIWIFDKRYDMAFQVPITTSVIGSQLNKEGLERIMIELLSKTFGRVNKL